MTQRIIPRTNLVWLDRIGILHTLSTDMLPPIRTALEWQQVYEYCIGHPAWLER